MSQGKLDPCLLRDYFDDHETLVLRVAGDTPGEDQSSGPVNLSIFPDVINLLTLATHEERERPSHSRVDIDAQNFFFAQSGPNIHLPIISGSSNASKTRSGDASKWRVTLTATFCVDLSHSLLVSLSLCCSFDFALIEFVLSF
jgi:hypothetical protein